MKFRKKPVVIEAEVLTQEFVDGLLEPEKFKPHRKEDGSIEVLNSFLKELGNGMYARVHEDHAEVFIRTPEGVLKANVGDYIITRVNGERYPCRPDIFKTTYERVYDQLKPINKREGIKKKWAQELVENNTAKDFGTIDFDGIAKDVLKEVE